MIDKIAEELHDKMAMAIDYQLIGYMDKNGIGLDDMMANCHSEQEIGKPTDIRYFYKDKEIFRIYLECSADTMAWKVVPN